VLFLTKVAGPASYLPHLVYAEKAEAERSKDALIFNCVQRKWSWIFTSVRGLIMLSTGAHQNTLENLALTLFSTLIAGLVYPKFAGAVCGTWSIARLLYTIGYSSGEPQKVSGNLWRSLQRTYSGLPPAQFLWRSRLGLALSVLWVFFHETIRTHTHLYASALLLTATWSLLTLATA
jgi:hypothetical protein